jgi:DNA-binding transcriptional LysR family regulator
MSEALMPWVRDGTIDFALSSVPVTASDPALEHVTLYFGKMAVVARAGHPLAARRSLTLAELAAYPWCLPARREMERRALDELYLESGLRPPEADIETTSTALMVAMVMGSDHLSFLPQELVYWEQDGGRLVALPVGGIGWQRGFGITRRRGRALNASAAAVVHALRAVARELYGPSPRGKRR